MDIEAFALRGSNRVHIVKITKGNMVLAQCGISAHGWTGWDQEYDRRQLVEFESMSLREANCPKCLEVSSE